MENLTEGQYQTLTRINVTASTLSFIGSFFIVLCYLCFKELRKFSFKLVFYLSLSDMFCSIFNMLGDPKEGALCYVQGYSTQFFSIASFLWTTTIAFTLHRTVVRHKADVEDFGPIFHAYVWGNALISVQFDEQVVLLIIWLFTRLLSSLQLSDANQISRHLSVIMKHYKKFKCRYSVRFSGTSFAMTIIPLMGNDYGPAGAQCWLQAETTAGRVLKFMTFYVPLWGAILFNGTVYFQVIRMVKFATRMAVGMADWQHQMETRPEMRALNRWGYYPLILIASWTFGTINRIHDFVEPGHKLFWLYCLHIATASLMGLFNSIAYGLNAAVRRTLHEKLELWWPEKYNGWRPKYFQISDTSEEMVSIEQKSGS